MASIWNFHSNFGNMAFECGTKSIDVQNTLHNGILRGHRNIEDRVNVEDGHMELITMLIQEAHPLVAEKYASNSSMYFVRQG